MKHTCEQSDCAFNDLEICSLSFEGDEKEAWENYGTEKCKGQVDWNMKHQSVVD